VVFVLDSAGTVHAERWHYMLDFVEWIVERLDVAADRTRVAVVYWSDSAYVGFTLDRYFVRQVRPLSMPVCLSHVSYSKATIELSDFWRSLTMFAF